MTSEYQSNNYPEQPKNRRNNAPLSIIKTERQLIGSLFYIKAHPEIIIGELILSIRPEWFTDIRNKNIISTLKIMIERGDVIMPDVAVQFSQIKNAYGLSEDEINQDLKKMMIEWARLLKRQRSQEKNIIEGLINVLRDRFMMSQLNDLSKKLPNIVKDNKTNKEKLSIIQNVIGDISETFSIPMSKPDGMDLTKAVADALLTREKIQKGDVRELGMKTGFPELDQAIGGFGVKKGKVYSIGGLSGMGKTTFAVNMITNFAKNNYKTLFFSYEMSEADIQYKILSSETGLPSNKIQHGMLDAQEWSLVSNTAENLGRLSINYLGYAELKSSDISILEQRVRKEVEEKSLDAILIDHIALVGYESLKNAKETDRVTAVARRLSRLAKELNIAVIILCQLNRDAEKRGTNETNRRPYRSDVKNSGAIWEESDVFIFIHRDDAFKANEKENQNKPKYCTIIVAKNRLGEENKDVTLVSELQYSRFTNMSNDHLLP